MSNYRVLIVDDTLIMREGLAAIFKGITGVNFVETCQDKQEAIKAVRSRRFDVVMIELQQELENGITLGHELLLIDPKLKVIVYTRQTTSFMISQLIRLGYHNRIRQWGLTKTPATKATAVTLIKAGSEVFGFMVIKNLTPQVLAQKLELLAQQIHPVDIEIINMLAERFNHLHLTPRELECSKLVSQAKSNLYIAQHLGISVQAVENLINSLYNKFAIGGTPKDPGRRVKLAYTIQHYYGSEDIAV